MFLVKFFKKHQKKILILMVILAALFLLTRQFRILEGVKNNRTVTIRPPPRDPIISSGSSGGSSTGSPTSVPANVSSGVNKVMENVRQQMSRLTHNAPGSKK